MSAILTTPPAQEPVTLAEAKQHLKIETALEDDLINRLITTARQHVEKHIDKVLIEQPWLVYFDDWPGSGEIKLPVAPITAIIDLRTYSDDDIAIIIDPSHYYVDMAGAPQKLVLRGSRIWLKPGRIANGIEIEVTAGYGPTAASVPAPLQTAMLLLIAHWYENRTPDCHAVGVDPIATKLQCLLGPFKRVRL